MPQYRRKLSANSYTNPGMREFRKRPCSLHATTQVSLHYKCLYVCRVGSLKYLRAPNRSAMVGNVSPPLSHTHQNIRGECVCVDIQREPRLSWHVGVYFFLPFFSLSFVSSCHSSYDVASLCVRLPSDTEQRRTGRPCVWAFSFLSSVFITLDLVLLFSCVPLLLYGGL